MTIIVNMINLQMMKIKTILIQKINNRERKLFANNKKIQYKIVDKISMKNNKHIIEQIDKIKNTDIIDYMDKINTIDK